VTFIPKSNDPISWGIRRELETEPMDLRGNRRAWQVQGLVELFSWWETKNPTKAKKKGMGYQACGSKTGFREKRDVGRSLLF